MRNQESCHRERERDERRKEQRTVNGFTLYSGGEKEGGNGTGKRREGEESGKVVQGLGDEKKRELTGRKKRDTGELHRKKRRRRKEVRGGKERGEGK